MFGTSVIVSYALEVLRGLQWNNSYAIGDAEQTNFGSVEELLNHDRPLFVQALLCVLECFIEVIGNDNPFPAASPSSLTTCGAPNSLSIIATVSMSVATPARAVGTWAKCITCGESFARFEFGCGRRGTKARDPGITNCIGNARNQRSFRPDNDEVGVKFHRERSHGGRIVDVNISQFRLARHPSIARAAKMAST